VNSMSFVVLLSLCCIPAVHSQQVKMVHTSFQLKEDCESAEQLVAMAATQPVPQMVTAKGVACFGYLRGYIDATVYMQSVRDAKPIYCGERNRDLRKLAASFVAYMTAHPEQKDAPAAESVAIVIAGTDPCKP
jgi:Rap1a immunity proteins